MIAYSCCQKYGSTFDAIKPDIVILNWQDKAVKIIGVIVSNDFRLNRAKRIKITKYQELKSDLRTTWSLKKIDTILVMIWTKGLIKKP